MAAFPKVNNDDSNINSNEIKGRSSTFFRHYSLKMRKGAIKSTYMYRMGWDDDPENPRFTLINDIFEQ
jgi:hypothetical protein